MRNEPGANPQATSPNNIANRTDNGRELDTRTKQSPERNDA